MNSISRFDRKTIRLKYYDYSTPGEYFVTICAHEHICIFGNIVDEEMQLSEEGEIIKEEWLRTANIRLNVELDSFVVMPNHIHGIIVLNETNNIHGRGTSQRAPTLERFGKPTHDSIPTIARLFKSVTTKRINEIRRSFGAPVWQRGYYEHIIRNEKDLNNVREYINPVRYL